MPNFTSRITSGAELDVWTDPATAEKPSRIAYVPARPQLYQLVPLVNSVEVVATVNDVEGEVDANLGGELFTASWAEVPGWPGPALASPAGQSSLVTFTPNTVGHHVLVHRRAGGGAVRIPFVVEEDA